MDDIFDRIQSFLPVPDDVVLPTTDLLQSGFAYAGIGDTVACQNCGIHLSDWKVTDDAFKRHLQYSPQCPVAIQANKKHSTETTEMSQGISDNLSGHTFGSQEDTKNDIHASSLTSMEKLVSGKNVRQAPMEGNKSQREIHGQSLQFPVQYNNCSREFDNTKRFYSTPQEHTAQSLPITLIRSQCNYPPQTGTIFSRQGSILSGTGDQAQAILPQSDLQSWQVKEKTKHFLREKSIVESTSHSINGQYPSQSQSIKDRFADKVNECSVPVQTASNTQYVPTLDIYTGVENKTDAKSKAKPKPRILNFRDSSDRLISFQDWPSNAVISAAEAVEAGLFYTGEADKLQCAWCAGRLFDWDVGDTAKGEHARHFPQCPFVKQFLSEYLHLSRVHPNSSRECSGGTSLPLEQMSMGRREETPEPSTPKDISPKDSDQSTSHNTTTTQSSMTSRDEVSMLEEENKRLRNLQTCVVCLEEAVSVTFMPCRHLVCCDSCSQHLDICPLCRVPIQGTVDTRLS